MFKDLKNTNSTDYCITIVGNLTQKIGDGKISKNINMIKTLFR